MVLARLLQGPVRARYLSTTSDERRARILSYTAPSAAAVGYSSWATYTGTDPDPTFDANDEVSFLANDSGKQVPTGTATPANTVAGTQQEIKVTDPLDPKGVGYVYLFQSSSSALTGGSAGTTGVQYAPNNTAGFNPEHSTITTGTYTLNYSDRWLNDGLTITTGGASGADVLERGRVQSTISRPDSRA